MAGPKVDKLTKERRVEAVYRLILDGWTPEQIFQNTSEWGVTERQKRHYINEADRRMKALAEADRETHFARHIAARRELARNAKTGRDKLAVLKDEAELLGLYPPKRHELGGKDGGAIEHHIIIEYADDHHDAAEATASA